MRYGILADIHANLEALQAVLKDGESRVDTWLFLGDVVGRGPDPVTTIDLLRRYATPFTNWQMGNHDLYVTERESPDGVRDYEANIHVDHRVRIRCCRNGAGRYLWAWCRRNWRLTRARPRLIAGINADYILVHGSLGTAEMNAGVYGKYIFPQGIVQRGNSVIVQMERLQTFKRGSRTTVFIHGHTHIPYLACKMENLPYPVLAPIRYDETPTDLCRFEYVFINPGSVGFPRNGDHRIHAAYGILDTHVDNFEFRRVHYNSEPTRHKMAIRGYDSILIRLLEGNHPLNPLRGTAMWKQWREIYTDCDWGWQPNAQTSDLRR